MHAAAAGRGLPPPPPWALTLPSVKSHSARRVRAAPAVAGLLAAAPAVAIPK